MCCGTKRLIEISCPSDCVHLVAAREHPAAVVRRQQELDVALLMPTLQGLTERQHQLFFLFHSVIARHTPEGFARLNDDDVAQAAGAAAATLETASRGVIYEHAAESPTARRLGSELTAMLEEVRSTEPLFTTAKRRWRFAPSRPGLARLACGAAAARLPTCRSWGACCR